MQPTADYCGTRPAATPDTLGESLTQQRPTVGVLTTEDQLLPGSAPHPFKSIKRGTSQLACSKPRRRMLDRLCPSPLRHISEQRSYAEIPDIQVLPHTEQLGVCGGDQPVERVSWTVACHGRLIQHLKC